MWDPFKLTITHKGGAVPPYSLGRMRHSACAHPPSPLYKGLGHILRPRHHFFENQFSRVGSLAMSHWLISPATSLLAAQLHRKIALRHATGMTHLTARQDTSCLAYPPLRGRRDRLPTPDRMLVMYWAGWCFYRDLESCI